MKTLNVRKSLAIVSAAALLVGATALAIPTAGAAAAAPTCKTDVKTNVETCTGALSNGAVYEIRVPHANFHGSMYFWAHGFRPTYAYPGYTPPNGKTVEELTPFSANTGKNITSQMLASGRAVAAFDRKTNGGYNWNAAESIPLMKELVDIAKAKYTSSLTKVIIYGSSGAGPLITGFNETYPGVADASGMMAGATNVSAALRTGCDLFYLLSVFADPNIKGCAAFGAAKGVNGHMLALQQLGLAGAVLTAWSKNLGAPALEYPAAIKPYGIPQRSALLLIGLLGGLPTKSSHMDGITTNAVIAEQSINSTVAILENFQDALGTATFTGQSIGEITGAGFYDNTKTDFSSLLTDEDAARFNLGLSGDDGINLMLGALKAAPRITGTPASVANYANLYQPTYASTTPMVLLSNEADRLVLVGNAVQYNDRAQAAYQARLDKWNAQTGVKKGAKPQPNTLSIYAITPETYTKYTAAGLPDLAGAPAVSGVGHQSFTVKQSMTWVALMEISAYAGRVPSATVAQKYLAKTPYLSSDLDFRPGELKYEK